MPQNLCIEGEGHQQDVLYLALKEVVPDFSYPDQFYGVLTNFLFANDHSFFDEQHLPATIAKTIQRLSTEDQDNLLTVLEGAKAIIQTYDLKDMAAYNELLLASKNNRFFTDTVFKN
ncbi:MAG: hypothetical protein AAGJ18_13365 [Bacteroidota bacterium]